MIAVVGLGFVGLTTALGFAYKGYKVYGYDADIERISELKKNIIPFHEPHLIDILEKHTDRNLFICNTLKESILNASIVFYCVGTPGKNNGETDLGHLKNAIQNSLNFIETDEHKVLVIKSTVPPTTTQEILKPLIEGHGFKVGKHIGLTNNPEFLREGFAWDDFIHPDRIVIGEFDEKSGKMVEDIYKPFEAPIYRVSLNTSEFIKYLSNTLLSTMISFSNEMSMIADIFGDIDISNAFKILQLDKRWFGKPAKMTSYVYPGCGFGGYCLPKDTFAIYRAAIKKGHESFFIKEILSVNDKVKRHLVEKIIKSSNNDDYIGILGLSFKPDSDDVRGTAAKDIIKMLIEKGRNKVIAYDPLASDNFKKTYDLPIIYARTLEEVTQKCDVIVILTAWQEFKVKKELLHGKTVIDGRYFLQ